MSLRSWTLSISLTFSSSITSYQWSLWSTTAMVMSPKTRGQFNNTFTCVIHKCSYCYQNLKQWLHLWITRVKVLLNWPQVESRKKFFILSSFNQLKKKASCWECPSFRNLFPLIFYVFSSRCMFSCSWFLFGCVENEDRRPIGLKRRLCGVKRRST